MNIKDIHAIYQYFQERYITFIFAQGSQKLSATVKMQSPFFYENLNNQTLIAYTFLAPWEKKQSYIPLLIVLMYAFRFPWRDRIFKLSTEQYLSEYSSLAS